MKTSFAISVLCLSAGALAACGSDDSSGATGLDGTSWATDAADGYELAGTLDLVFADGTISVTGGCNILSGSYSVDDGVLTTGPMAKTERACEVTLMDQDSWFFGLLEGGLEVTMSDDELVLASDDVTIELEPAS